LTNRNISYIKVFAIWEVLKFISPVCFVFYL
jgi:hypothetical protein